MSFGVYVHWPFCQSKCPYCDFNSHVHEKIDHDQWTQAYLREIEHTSHLMPGRVVDTVFFGGGTPSLMKPEQIDAILTKIKSSWKTNPNWEVTLEANPTSVEIGKFQGFKDAGINRVSLGIQSFNEDDLKFLGRKHNATEAKQALDIAAKTFERFSFDLIYARPNQTVAAWEAELNEALSIAKTHLSLYQLTIEQGTPFYTQHARGDFKIPDQDLGADLYDATQVILDKQGMPAYEVSNHAIPGQESRHNLIYWRYGDYAGIGPGAHGRLTMNGEKKATRTHRAPEIWLERVAKDNHGYHPFEDVTRQQRVQECLMMGLRLSEGVPWQRVHDEYGGDAREFLSSDKLDRLIDEGMLVDDGKTITATATGRKCLNAVLGYWLAAGG